MKMRIISAALVCAAVVYSVSAGAQEPLVRFEGGIGVIPVSNVATSATGTTVTRNTVRGVEPAGQIWVIEKLDAEVRINGQITVDGKGLVFGGGNNIGRATGQFVFATLICEAAAPFAQHRTNVVGVQLAPNGDFKIDDMLSPPPPFACPSPTLLIRNAANLAWFAAGIPKQ